MVKILLELFALCLVVGDLSAVNKGAFGNSDSCMPELTIQWAGAGLHLTCLICD
jgi:hypothetical protein